MQRKLRLHPDDLRASVVVFLVAVPLSLGIAAASGAPLMGGIIAAVVGGALAALVGGVPLQVSGPAAGLTVVVAEVIHDFGWKATCAIVAAAGALQVVLGLTRMARWALAVSPAVVHGMLAGIGVTIVMSQVHVLLGSTSRSGVWASISDLPQTALGHEPAALLVGLLTIAVLLLWPRLAGRRMALVPGPLVAVVVATAFAAIAGLDVRKVDLPSDPLRAVGLPDLPDASIASVVVAVVTIALIASVESLLSAVAVQRLASERNGTSGRVDLDRELVGQGIANLASGLAGGLPVTGVIVRGSTNVLSGAVSRGSAAMHAVWIAIFVMLLGTTVELVPMAALAGLLVVVGARLVDLAHLRELRHHGELTVYVVTLVGVISVDLLTGVVAGLVTAAALTLYRLTWSNVQYLDGDPAIVRAEGALSFVTIPRLRNVLGHVPEGKDVTLELVADYMDHATYDCLQSWATAHRRSGARVRIDEKGHAWFTASHRGSTAALRAQSAPLPRWLMPWSDWQATAGQDVDRVLDVATAAAPSAAQDVRDLIEKGVAEFNRETAPLVRPSLEPLSASQAPKVAFLTCADSRIVPNLITSSGPGDLFTIRNIGNIVPPAESSDTSVAAALEFAILALKVEAIVVCGHSNCGAMKALMGDRSVLPPSVGSWLELGDDSVRYLERWTPLVDATPDDLARANVACQLDRLAQLPVVREKLASGELALVGMFFDIAGGSAAIYDQETGAFRIPTVAPLG